MRNGPAPCRIAIACGGTGGHLYPGLAVGGRLLERGAEVTLLVADKAVDRRAVEYDRRFRVVTLPGVGFSLRGAWTFALRFWRSYRCSRAEFQATPPRVVLSMGSFTGAPPALAGRRLGTRVALHEANAIPGRANRWVSRWAHRRYVFFPEAIERLPGPGEARVVGMPVRDGFRDPDLDPGACRSALGLLAGAPVLLVMGGSQGASGINRRVVAALPHILSRLPEVQILHLTGARDEASIREAYRAAGARAVVRAFLTEMDLALGAADLAVSRAGASSLAEFAALRVPAILLPYPHAADDHQRANARAVARSGGAVLLDESAATPHRLGAEIVRWFEDARGRADLRERIAAWHRPDADLRLADDLYEWACEAGSDPVESPAAPAPVADRRSTPA